MNHSKFQILAVLCAVFLVSFSTELSAQATEKITYQGKLTDGSGNPVSDGTYNIKFSLYDAINSGSASWDETQGVSVQGGIFNVLLGDITALSIDFNKPYWLGVKVGSDAEMTPRTALSSTPYSMHAISIANNSVTNSKIANNTIDPTKMQKGNDGFILSTEAGQVQWKKDLVPVLFRWRATASNIVANRTVIDNPDLNGNPNAVVTATHIYRSDFLPAIGVWYNGANWTVYTEDSSAMIVNEEFAVFYVK